MTPLFQDLGVLLDELLADFDVAAHSSEVQRRVLGVVLHVDVRIGHAEELLDNLHGGGDWTN